MSVIAYEAFWDVMTVMVMMITYDVNKYKETCSLVVCGLCRSNVCAW
jgi:hypothetical protein